MNAGADSGFVGPEILYNFWGGPSLRKRTKKLRTYS